MAFGRPAFKKIIQAIENEKNEMNRAVYFLRLAEWISLSVGDETLANELRLNSDEMEAAKKTVIEHSDTQSGNELFYLNYSFPDLIKNEKNESEKKRMKGILKKSLQHRWGSVRGEVAKMFGEIGDSSDIADLEKLNDDPDVDSFMEKKRQNEIRATGVSNIHPAHPVQEAAKEAIEKIKARGERK